MYKQTLIFKSCSKHLFSSLLEGSSDAQIIGAGNFMSNLSKYLSTWITPLSITTLSSWPIIAFLWHLNVELQILMFDLCNILSWVIWQHQTSDITVLSNVSSKYNSEMLGPQFESKSTHTTFQASNCYILRVHKWELNAKLCFGCPSCHQESILCDKFCQLYLNLKTLVLMGSFNL